MLCRKHPSTPTAYSHCVQRYRQGSHSHKQIPCARMCICTCTDTCYPVLNARGPTSRHIQALGHDDALASCRPPCDAAVAPRRALHARGRVPSLSRKTCTDGPRPPDPRKSLRLRAPQRIRCVADPPPHPMPSLARHRCADRHTRHGTQAPRCNGVAPMSRKAKREVVNTAYFRQSMLVTTPTRGRRRNYPTSIVRMGPIQSLTH